MSKYKAFLLIRWSAWSFVWWGIHPEFFSIQAWINNPDIALPGFSVYLVTGAILEFIYRMLAWGGMTPRRAYPAVVRPECPEHPWISLLEDYPKAGDKFEVFCADGITRTGIVIESDDGRLGIVMSFSSEDRTLYEKDPWRLRPTHWRILNDEPINTANK